MDKDDEKCGSCYFFQQSPSGEHGESLQLLW